MYKANSLFGNIFEFKLVDMSVTVFQNVYRKILLLRHNHPQ